MCEPCWRARSDQPQPYRLKNRELEVCCFCGQTTRSGIYWRAAPTDPPHCTQDHGD